jgi:hypothetical protein
LTKVQKHLERRGNRKEELEVNQKREMYQKRKQVFMSHEDLSSMMSSSSVHSIGNLKHRKSSFMPKLNLKHKVSPLKVSLLH